jgi:hypothetical protein
MDVSKFQKFQRSNFQCKSFDLIYVDAI